MTPPATVPTVTRQARLWWPVLTGGGVLGLFAFVGDEVPGVAGLVILTLTSTGFVWGMAALLAGYASPHYRSAVRNATTLLLVATVTYYGLILVHGRRWHSGQLADGSSAAMSGLASVGRHSVLWLVAAVAAGVTLGWLGSTVRCGTRLPASLAAGTAVGLLAGQGLHIVVTFQAWRVLDDTFSLGNLVAAGVSVALATVGGTLLLARRRATRSWPTFIASAVVSSVAGALLWSQIESIRSTM
ncbi:hypothetical protein ACIBMZ_13635 [Micromonospora sp. NPDC049900]|uniref:hypothetical protein n=1 Tax=Micromonospora sp. NPDC049900 TaxID=3364275 RepID=UPI0037A4836B